LPRRASRRPRREHALGEIAYATCANRRDTEGRALAAQKWERWMSLRWLVRVLASLGIGLAVGAPAAAVQITYEAIDLADPNPGDDLWLYRYELDAFKLPAGYGFSVFFDDPAASALDLAGFLARDWDLLVIQADPALPDIGFFDALLVGTPKAPVVFEVQFLWKGAGPPGAQPFVVYDASFQTVEAGVTQLPEAGALSLLAAGALSLLAAGALALGGRARGGRR
jgi:hypothetical protein